MRKKNFQSVFTHQSLLASHLHRERAASLACGLIPPHHLYLSTHQSQLWLQVHHLCSPLRRNPSLRQPYLQAAKSSLHCIHHRHATLLSLGCGGSSKDILILKQWKKANCHPSFSPVDASLDLSLLSSKAALSTSSSVTPIVTNLFSPCRFSSLLTPLLGSGQRLLTAYGILPNYPPEDFFQMLRRWSRPRDTVLISANLSPVANDSKADYYCSTQRILDQYSNLPTREWLGAALQDYGIAHQVSPIRFSIEWRNSCCCVEASVSWRKSVRRNKFRKLTLFRSYRHTPSRMENLLRAFRWKTISRWIDTTGQEGVWMIRRP